MNVLTASRMLLVALVAIVPAAVVRAILCR
jgi:hypothetical protein